MNSKRKKKGLKILSCCIIGILGLASSLTVLAYEQPTILKVKNIDGKNIGQAEAVFIVDNITEEDIMIGDSLALLTQTANKMKITTEKYFQDERGNIYDVYDIAVQPRCAHTYVDSTYNEHKKAELVVQYISIGRRDVVNVEV